MAGNGPPPNPHARRRNARPLTTKLPAEGRKGPLPIWPLLAGGLPPKLAPMADVIAEHELVLWAELWATPQAVAWEQLSWTRDVAQYVRWQVRAELGDLEASREARLLSDRLGLNPLALLRLRWEVSSDEVAEQRTERTARSTAAKGPRRGLKAVDGTG